MEPIQNELESIDFRIERGNLYREESYTDLNVGSIRKMVPVRDDGSPDETRSAIFLGVTQLLSPQGPLPVQARLMANTMREALDAYPEAMKAAVKALVAEARKLKEQEESRIVVPGR